MQLDNPKLLSLENALTKREEQRSRGERVVLVNGCFDLLHAGHIYYLQKAAELGDALYVALNGAKSVSVLKGPARPIQDDVSRAYALAAMECVDTIFIFQAPQLVSEIEMIKPDVYAKAGDYTLETLNVEERQMLESVGAEIKFVEYLEGFSTTDIIEKIHNASKTDSKC